MRKDQRRGFYLFARVRALYLLLGGVGDWIRLISSAHYQNLIDCERDTITVA